MSEQLKTIKPKWVKASKYCELTGDNINSLYVRRARGTWVDGVHAKNVPGIGLMVNLEEVEKWIENCPLE